MNITSRWRSGGESDNSRGEKGIIKAQRGLRPCFEVHSMAWRCLHERLPPLDLTARSDPPPPAKDAHKAHHESSPSCLHVTHVSVIREEAPTPREDIMTSNQGSESVTEVRTTAPHTPAGNTEAYHCVLRV